MSTQPVNPYTDGLADGLAWDLDGFADWAAVERASDGWSEATVCAMTREWCAQHWGVPAHDDGAWRTACREYDRGAHEGACASQHERTGQAPGGAR